MSRLPFDIDTGTVISIVLDPGFTIVGTFLGFDKRHHCEPIPEVVNDEFITVQLTVGFGPFPAGTVVAINVDQIRVVGPIS